jgi:hypothetical protein
VGFVFGTGTPVFLYVGVQPLIIVHSGYIACIVLSELFALCLVFVSCC